jgi:hypothetical protein
MANVLAIGLIIAHRSLKERISFGIQGLRRAAPTGLTFYSD